MKNYVQLRRDFFISLFLIFQTTICYAEHNTTIDYTYNKISQKVLEWSEYLDLHISHWLDDNTSNPKCLAQDLNSFSNSNQIYNVDSFFQNNRYLNDTEDIYIRLRLNSYLYSRKSNKMNVKLNAQLPFNRCRQQWKLFLQNPTHGQRENKLTDTSSGGVGIRYYRQEGYGINSSYSLGFSANSPYLRARYKLPIKLFSWKIEPIQIFKYSKKYYFEEETNIYFDKSFDDDLFRIILHRKSASTVIGTDYGITFQYYLYLGKNAGFEFSQSFFGNTHYSHYYAFDKNYNNINNYVSSISWRENIWRKWLYFEIRPTVNFHKDFNYKPSYTLRFLFDIYFGKYN